ncbi:hypothetical protein EVAR_24523_1 [Eumeta japonica]|uniref:Uncharacterized protein n=1 Tax=Eumeta variegata TaxID=151549 RepID=A0A4C1US52_EUMVA|nr:hypothetical protein EVAR_24523_1 [Eumeta japonica]
MRDEPGAIKPARPADKGAIKIVGALHSSRAVYCIAVCSAATPAPVIPRTAPGSDCYYPVSIRPLSLSVIVLRRTTFQKSYPQVSCSFFLRDNCLANEWTSLRTKTTRLSRYLFQKEFTVRR